MMRASDTGPTPEELAKSRQTSVGAYKSAENWAEEEEETDDSASYYSRVDGDSSSRAAELAAQAAARAAGKLAAAAADDDSDEARRLRSDTNLSELDAIALPPHVDRSIMGVVHW